jgi:hypothetical protein
MTPATALRRQLALPHRMIGTIRAPIVFYPLATPAAAVLYLGTMVASHPIWLIRPLLVALAIGLGLTLVVTAVVRDKHRAGVASWALLVGLIADDPRPAILLFGIAAVVIVVGVRLRGTPWTRGPRISSALTAFGVVLLVATAIRALQTGALEAAIAELSFDLEAPRPAAVTASDLPDIYVILLDAYPGARAARSEPSFDADAFPSALRERGFDVAADSRSNYLTTRLSLPSMFDAGYLDRSSSQGQPGTHVADARALRRATDSSRLLTDLRSAGYECVAISSGYSEIGPNRVDRLVVPPQLNELEWAILNATAVGDLVNAASPTYIVDDVRARVATTLDEAATLAEEPHTRPRFVLAHVPAPHGPWVANAEGQASGQSHELTFGGTPDASTALAERRRAYFAYAHWVGDLAIVAVDRIRAASASPPVIFVVSDHGPDFDFSDADPLAYNLDDRTSNFTAVFVPNRDDVIADDITLVNLFPAVLNGILGWDLPRSPDRFWAWPANGSILDFVELDPATWKATAGS